MKILIADDQALNRTVLAAPLEALGHECIEAEDGAEAVLAFDESAPDLVLMDVKMPIKSGYQATKEIKEKLGDRHVPIIFVTAQANDDSLTQCLECGGDDYLQKPINPIVLVSKINAHLRIQSLNRELRAKTSEIQRLNEMFHAEHETGNHVLSHALSRNLTKHDNLRSYLVPQSQFNGDILLCAEKPLGGLYVFLGDITGHGLAAAIGTIPLSQVFFTMTRKGKSAASIIREMNRSLRSFLPRSMFCAAVLIEVDAPGTSMKVWSGGLPICVHLQHRTGTLSKIKSRHLPLGVLDNEHFDVSAQSLKLELGDSLIMMTDGIPESLNQHNDMLGLAEVERVLKENQREPFDALLTRYQTHTQGMAQIDDVSLVQVFAKPCEAKTKIGPKLAGLPWRVMTRFDAECLGRISDPVMHALKLIPEHLELTVFNDRIALVLAELFSNALEHGLLGLSSETKNEVDGFAKYYAQREERLETLQSGTIDLEFVYDQVKEPRILTIILEDSGSGFERKDVLEKAHSSQTFGRGMSLVQSLCESIVYNEIGNRVEARIKLT